MTSGEGGDLAATLGQELRSVGAGESQRIAEEVGRLHALLGDDGFPVSKKCQRRVQDARVALQWVANHLGQDAAGSRRLTLRPRPPCSAGVPSVREEANALVSFAVRNGFIEDLHAGKRSALLDDPSLSRISDAEMRKLMIESTEGLAQMLVLKETDADEYWRRIRSQLDFTRAWDTTPPEPLMPVGLRRECAGLE